MIDAALWQTEYNDFASALRAASDWQEVPSLVPVPQFGVAAVHSLEYLDEGDNEGPPLVALGVLCDGRWFCVEAWRDYTGWGCQDGGSVRVGPDRGTVVRLGLSESERLKVGAL